jgi:hypothetical protein
MMPWPRGALDFPAEYGVNVVRRFLAEVAEGVTALGRKMPPELVHGLDQWLWERPDEPGQFRPIWSRFVPVTIRLADPIDETLSSVSLDVDGSTPTAFLTGIKIVDRVRRYPRARMQQVSVRTYLTWPARYEEIEERAAVLKITGHPMALGPEDPESPDTIFRALTTRESKRLHYIPSDEFVGLAALMAARNGPVVAYSEDGLWPRHPLVKEVAQRLELWILRRPLAEIPPRVLRRIRCVRYLPLEEAE